MPTLKTLSGLASVLALATMAGCAGMTQQERNTAIGAGVGAVGGSILTGGSTAGTLGGAAVGGVIGHEIDKKKKRGVTALETFAAAAGAFGPGLCEPSRPGGWTGIARGQASPSGNKLVTARQALCENPRDNNTEETCPCPAAPPRSLPP